MIRVGLINLYEAKVGGVFLINSVPDVKLLENMGVRVGVRVKVQKRYAFGGPVLLRVEDCYTVAIGKDIAMQIGVLKGEGAIA